MITKTQGKACLDEAQDVERSHIITRTSAVKALAKMGWCIERKYFDYELDGAFDRNHRVVALCFAAAVAGVQL